VDKAAGLITTQKGLGSRCVVAAIKANIPAIVGLPEIDSFPNGTWVEVDPHRHMVYRISHQLSDEET
jgi:phosphohistidine swiveling domain-containing protein